MNVVRLSVVIFLWNLATLSYCQEGNFYSRITPQTSRFALFSEVFYTPDNKFGDAFREFRLNTDFLYPRGISFHTVTEYALANRELQNQPRLRLAQAYIRLINNSKADSSFLSFSSTLKAGYLQWFPPINQVLVLSENINLYTKPLIFAGIEENFSLYIGKKKKLLLQIDFLAGDTLGGNANLVLDFYNTFLKYETYFYKNFGITAQVGKAVGFTHLLNYVYVTWSPKSEELQFNFQAGKLGGFEETPYGISVGVERKFRNVILAAFYQRRINQEASRQIGGFSLQFIKPKWLATLMNTYSLYIDLSSGSVFMNIPVLTVQLNK